MHVLSRFLDFTLVRGLFDSKLSLELSPRVIVPPQSRTPRSKKKGDEDENHFDPHPTRFGDKNLSSPGLQTYKHAPYLSELRSLPRPLSSCTPCSTAIQLVRMKRRQAYSSAVLIAGHGLLASPSQAFVAPSPCSSSANRHERHQHRVSINANTALSMAWGPAEKAEILSGLVDWQERDVDGVGAADVQILTESSPTAGNLLLDVGTCMCDDCTFHRIFHGQHRNINHGTLLLCGGLICPVALFSLPYALREYGCGFATLSEWLPCVEAL